MTVICDLDGVIWLADTLVPGADRAVARLRDRGERVLFVTNNSFASKGDVEAKLARLGIPARGDVVTSAMAAAALVEPGERVLVCGGPGVVESLHGRGAEVVTDGDADVVMVGFHRDFTWDRMRIAARAVRNGARFVATNDDATYPTPNGPVPGAGSIWAGIATASGVQPVVAGKPYPPMASTVRAIVGPDGHDVMVGDRADTDGRFAVALGARFALVLSGVTDADHLPVDPPPDLVAPDIGAVVELLA